jgi:hypothetical protein
LLLRLAGGTGGIWLDIIKILTFTTAVEFTHQEADVMAGFPVEVLLLLSAFRIRGLGLLVCALSMLLGLGRVFLAFGMLIPAMRLGGGTMGLCSGLVKFGRLVV